MKKSEKSGLRDCLEQNGWIFLKKVERAKNTPNSDIHRIFSELYSDYYILVSDAFSEDRRHLPLEVDVYYRRK